MGVGVLNSVKITQQAGSYVFRSRYILPLHTNVGKVYTFLDSRNRMTVYNSHVESMLNIIGDDGTACALMLIFAINLEIIENI